MNNTVKRLTKKIMSNSRMELDFFMYLPKGEWTGSNKESVFIEANPVLFLRCKQPKHVNTEYDFNKANFKITRKNQYMVVKFFNKIIDWLFGDDYKDLFLYDDDNKLIFNADYKSLHVTTPRGDYTQQVMQAIPTVVEIGNKTYEGARLYINTSNYSIPLTYEEVSMLFNIIKDFRFTEEVTAMMLCWDYLEKNNLVSKRPNNKISKTPFD